MTRGSLHLFVRWSVVATGSSWCLGCFQSTDDLQSDNGMAVDPVCEVDCGVPVGLRLTNSVSTPLLPNNAFDDTPHSDVCPQDQVLVGLKVMIGNGGGKEFVASIGAQCALLAFAEASLTLAPAGELGLRGTVSNGARTELMSCAAGEVVVGWEGRADVNLSQIGLSCAPLQARNESGRFSIDVGEARRLRPQGDSSTGLAISPQLCPPGLVARGSHVLAPPNVNGKTQWVDRFALICARPKLTLRPGAPCTDSTDCDAGSCTRDVCQPNTCPARAGCSCIRLESHNYLFCADPLAFTAAEQACDGQGTRLAKVESGIENGWLFWTARHLNSGVPSPQWIGGTDNEVEGEWRWLDENRTLFWSVANGGRTANSYAAWIHSPEQSEPDNGGSGQNCLNIAEDDDHWNDTQCWLEYGFVCEMD